MKLKPIAVFLSVLILMTPISAVAEPGWGVYADDVFGFVVHASEMWGLDYNETTKTIKIDLGPYNWTGMIPPPQPPMGGMAVIELLFNRTVKPSGISAVLLMYDGEEYDILDMLVNFTMTNTQYWWSSTEEYVEASYLLAYIYLFANHSIFYEQPVDLVFDKPYIEGPNDPDWTEPGTSFSLSGESVQFAPILSDDDSRNPVQVILDYSTPTTTTETPTTTTSGPTTTDSVEGPDLLVIGAIAGAIVIAVIVLVWYRRR